MKNISKKIVFFGTDDFSLTTLASLIKSGYNISAVVTKQDSKSGRGQKLEESSVKKYAVKNNINVWQPSRVSEIDEKIKSLGNDVIGILVSFGKIIPKKTIELFNPGIINIHPSILPKYRGPSPIESAIKNGDNKTGISIMQLSEDMDAGPVYFQKIYNLTGQENRISLRDTLSCAGANELLRILPSIVDGSLLPTPQDNNQATYCKLIDKKDSQLNPEKLSAAEAERIVRAHLGFPKTKIMINKHTVVITKSHTENIKRTILDIECRDKNYLSIDELIAPSGRTMSASDFINGYS